MILIHKRQTRKMHSNESTIVSHAKHNAIQPTSIKFSADTYASTETTWLKEKEEKQTNKPGKNHLFA